MRGVRRSSVDDLAGERLLVAVVGERASDGAIDEASLSACVSLRRFCASTIPLARSLKSSSFALNHGQRSSRILREHPSRLPSEQMISKSARNGCESVRSPNDWAMGGSGCGGGW